MCSSDLHDEKVSEAVRANLPEIVAAGDELGEVGADRLADLLVVPQPVARAAREQLVPFRRARRLALAAVLTHALLVHLFGARRHSRDYLGKVLRSTPGQVE